MSPDSSQRPRDFRYGRFLGPIYRRHIRNLIRPGLPQQHFKLIYDLWWYLPLLRMRTLPISQRRKLMAKLISIDWFLEHAHKPCEIVPIFMELSNRRGRGDAVVEAGCWKGGTSTKFSIMCDLFGYRLHIFDSFQGVPEWGYAYQATQSTVADNIRRFGEDSVCTFHPGWFKDTLRNQPVPFPVRLVYIDCDTVGGTLDVLSGVVPRLTPDGVIYTQDYHIAAVRRLLHDSSTWTNLGSGPPKIQPLVRNIARIDFATITKH
jgi:O-methyltransferase